MRAGDGRAGWLHGAIDGPSVVSSSDIVSCNGGMRGSSANFFPKATF